jgi:hypothetical protein
MKESLFNSELIDKVFAEDRDLIVATKDSSWVLYKFDRDSKYEFRVEKNFDTLHRFYLEKNEGVKSRLVDFLREVSLFEQIS